MSHAIRQRFIGLDVNGRPISGLILCAGRYGRGPIPLYYKVATDPNGHKTGIAFVPGEVIHEHLDNIALMESMEADCE